MILNLRFSIVYLSPSKIVQVMDLCWHCSNNELVLASTLFLRQSQILEKSLNVERFEEFCARMFDR